jgi:hypothetical protein
VFSAKVVAFAFTLAQQSLSAPVGDVPSLLPASLWKYGLNFMLLDRARPCTCALNPSANAISCFISFWFSMLPVV